MPCTLSCGAPALELTGSGVGSTWATIWGLPTPGIKPSSPALQGGLLTTGPPRKSRGKSSFKIVSPGRPIALSALRVWTAEDLHHGNFILQSFSLWFNYDKGKAKLFIPELRSSGLALRVQELLPLTDVEQILAQSQQEICSSEMCQNFLLHWLASGNNNPPSAPFVLLVSSTRWPVLHLNHVHLDCRQADIHLKCCFLGLTGLGLIKTNFLFYLQQGILESSTEKS